jgi:molybdenum cofactor cytidylyltransferase
MQFGSCPVTAAKGGILAHQVRAGSLSFRKGRVLSDDDVAALKAANVAEVVIARLEAGDIGEDEAASRIASALASDDTRIGAAFTGRANLYAERDGVAVIDRDTVDALNRIDEAITVAVVPPYSRVDRRQMLATVKIIPFAAPRDAVDSALAILAKARGAVRVAAFQPKRAGLISTHLPATKPSLLDKNRSALEARLDAIGSTIIFERKVAHDTAAVAAAIADAARSGADPIFVFGASAITDRRDVIPAAIVAAGGQVDHFGMPVDPGNLLLLGRAAGRVVVGLPSCARSPKLNGVDFVLWRLAADLPVGREEIAAMGVGGLLTEIPSRPQPRDERPADVPRQPRIGAIVLAAGLASRFGGRKLLEAVNGKPLVRHAVEAAKASHAEPAIVVTGNASAEVDEALSGIDISIVNNPDYAKGLSTSLKCGLKNLPEFCDGAIILLGDMPGVSAALVDKLIAAFDPSEGRAICVATRNGKRGNPVLWARRFFPEMLSIEGDVGARHLLTQYGESVCEVEAADDGPLIDIDTPEALAAYRAR